MFTRLFARQFFVRTSAREITSVSHKPALMRRLVILLGGLLSPILFILSMGILFSELATWEAGFIIPLAGICWTVIYGLTSDQGGWLIGTVPLTICAIIEVAAQPLFHGALMLFALSLWSQRAIYLVAERWFRELISQSYEAYVMLEDHIDTKPKVDNAHQHD